MHDYGIYHSRDLDGITSGALQKMFLGIPFTDLIGHDYGQKLDLRKFKNKDVVMCDVSLEPERMFSLANNASSFIFVDHHISKKDELLEYSKEHGIDYVVTSITGQIQCFDFYDAGLVFYFSEKLAVCEMMVQLFANPEFTQDAKRIVRCLGQYDTWRNNNEKQLHNDEDWKKIVLPLQWGMREHRTPEKVFHVLKGQIDDIYYRVVFDILISKGKSVLNYQEAIDVSNMERNSFTFELEVNNKKLRVLALNGGPFNSNTFQSAYNPDYHDLMMPFVFNGQEGHWTFSMYTTKNNVDILSIAKAFCGGGHKQACGFQVAADKVSFIDNQINFLEWNKK